MSLTRIMIMPPSSHLEVRIIITKYVPIIVDTFILLMFINCMSAILKALIRYYSMMWHRPAWCSANALRMRQEIYILLEAKRN